MMKANSPTKMNQTTGSCISFVYLLFTVNYRRGAISIDYCMCITAKVVELLQLQNTSGPSQDVSLQILLGLFTIYYLQLHSSATFTRTV
jgi:hypothetical protein